MKKDFGSKIIIVILVLISVIGLSWLITCGLVALIMKCFHTHFTWEIGTGVWLILLIIISIVKGTNH